jgi:hypothetical protein
MHCSLMGYYAGINVKPEGGGRPGKGGGIWIFGIENVQMPNSGA